MRLKRDSKGMSEAEVNVGLLTEDRMSTGAMLQRRELGERDVEG